MTVIVDQKYPELGELLMVVNIENQEAHAANNSCSKNESQVGLLYEVFLIVKVYTFMIDL